MAEHAVPVLPSRDLPETLRFYAALGFDDRGAPREDRDYLILGRAGVVLHFVLTPDVDPLTTAGMCYAYVDDADAVHALWRDALDGAAGAAGASEASEARLEPPVTTDYGMREFALVDPSGNLVRVGSPVA